MNFFKLKFFNTIFIFLFLLFCLSVFHFWFYGIDLGRWIPMYNGVLTQHMRLPYSSSMNVILKNITHLRFFLNVLSSYVYTMPVALFFFSVMARMIQLVLLFFLFKEIIREDKTALLVTLVLSFASGILGLEIWGISGILVYDVAQLAFIFILLALNALFRKKMVIAGFLLGIASLLEAPTGVAIFAILNVALFLSFLMEIDQETSIRAIVGFLVGFLLVVFPMIYSYFISNVNLAAHVLAIKEWYQFLIVRSPGDGLLSFTLWKYGPNIFSLIILYFAVRPVANLAFTERLLIGIIIVFMLILLVEILHAQGVFFGALSKIFLSIQFQRSYILLPIMLAPLLGKVYLYDDFFADKNAGQRIILFICYAMAIFLFLQVNQYVSLALSVFSVIFLVLSTQSRKYKMIILLGCLLAVVLYIMLPAEARQSWANFMAIWTELFHMPARLMMVVFLVILFLSYRLSFKGGVSYLSHQVFLWLLFIMTAAFLILDVFLNANNGEFRRSVVPFFTHQEYRYATVLDVLRIKDAPYINPNEFTWSKFRDKTERDLFIQAAQFLSDRRAIPYSLWLAEPSASGRLSPQLLAGLPLYVDESDRALSELSFSYADDYNRRLKNVFGLSHGMAWLYQDGNFRTRMQKAFNQLTVKKLKQLGQNNGIGYILTRQRYPELQRIYKNKIFNIYKIPVSTVWEKRFRAVQLK